MLMMRIHIADRLTARSAAEMAEALQAGAARAAQAEAEETDPEGTVVPAETVRVVPDVTVPADQTDEMEGIPVNLQTTESAALRSATMTRMMKSIHAADLEYTMY